MIDAINIVDVKQGDHIHIRCAHCGAIVSRPVTVLPLDHPSPQESGEPLFAEGGAKCSLPETRAEDASMLLVQGDLVHLVLTDDWDGCCGPSSKTPNMRCQCGKVIACLTADCWTDHFVRFPGSEITIHAVKIQQ